MKYLLDTNVLSDFVRDRPGVRRHLRAAAINDVAVSVITEFEAEFGLRRATALPPAIERAMRDLLAAVAVLPFEREDARAAATLRAALATQGTPIGPYDLLLAATAVRHSLAIVTHNKSEFSRIAGLKVEDWRED